jgi:hypothetical protein
MDLFWAASPKIHNESVYLGQVYYVEPFPNMRNEVNLWTDFNYSMHICQICRVNCVASLNTQNETVQLHWIHRLTCADLPNTLNYFEVEYLRRFEPKSKIFYRIYQESRWLLEQRQFIQKIIMQMYLSSCNLLLWPSVQNQILRNGRQRRIINPKIPTLGYT